MAHVEEGASRQFHPSFGLAVGGPVGQRGLGMEPHRRAVGQPQLFRPVRMVGEGLRGRFPEEAVEAEAHQQEQRSRCDPQSA